MPPVTTNAIIRVHDAQPRLEKKKVKPRIPNASPRLRKSPRNQRKIEPVATKDETTKTSTNRITYNRDLLMTFRDSPQSKKSPDLPSIPGVTAPREPREIPQSLIMKLQKKGVKIDEIVKPIMTSEKSTPPMQLKTNTSQKTSEQTSQMTHLKIRMDVMTSQPTLKGCSTDVTKPNCDAFNSCILHVI
uniref:Uncharacterized protein n=1 Tax=Ciona savignyi TaxID=51511 RepID=H2YHP0_CIOSA